MKRRGCLADYEHRGWRRSRKKRSMKDRQLIPADDQRGILEHQGQDERLPAALNRGRSRRIAPVLCVALCGLCSRPGHADETPMDPTVARGAHIARTICSGCHVVAHDQHASPRLDLSTPSFVEIANRRGTTVESLQRFLAITHRDLKTGPVTMPAPDLTREDAAAVSRYILSLRTH